MAASNSAASRLAAAVLVAATLSGCAVSVNVPSSSVAVTMAVPLASPCDDIERSRGIFVTDDGASIYWERAGRGRAVVLIHGLGGNHAVWHRQVPSLACRYSVVTYSQRGFAPSSADAGALDTDRLVADLNGLLDHLDIDSVAVVGQSMGGWTALGLALAHPERVHRLVLADTVAGIFDEQIADHYEAVVARARALADTPPPLGSHPALDPAFAESDREGAYLYQLLTTFGSPPPGRIAAELGATRFAAPGLAANRVPTLFVVGERDRIFPPEIVRRAAEQLGQSRVEVVGNSGHSPYYEQPRLWEQVVTAFLEETD